MKTKLFTISVAMLLMFGLASCDLDYFPSDELSSEVLLKDAGGAQYVMDGCYALLKDQVEYIEYASGNTYVRHYFQLTEYPSDNICLSGRTTDPLYQANTYTMTDNLKNIGTPWMLAYKVIFMCNTVIEKLDEKDAANHQLLGEAYFLRALMHFNMTTLFAKPYVLGRENPGVVLRLSTDTENTERSTVGKCYDAVAADFEKAAELLDVKSRGNGGYPCKDAALGMLSRVYLYMGRYEDVINTVNTMLGDKDPNEKLDQDFAHYFANAKSSVETLFCIAHEVTDDHQQSSAGSMYNSDGGGWGEVYPSDPLMYLYERYPEDVRYTAYLAPQFVGEDTVFVKEYDAKKKEWKNTEAVEAFLKQREQDKKDEKGMQPIPEELIQGVYTKSVYFPDMEVAAEEGRPCLAFHVEETDNGYVFNDSMVATPETKQDYYIEPRLVNGEYIEYHVTYKGEDCVAHIYDNVAERNTYPKIFVKKFGYQDGSPTLSSPVFCRWGEVILNRAEAEAHLGDDAAALADVDIIRKRAGIPDEGLFTSSMHGYNSVLEVVLDERRLELAFEGHRMYDVYRNKLSMNREYPGVQPWEIIAYDDPRIQYPIPFVEYSVSRIEQNK